MHELVKDTKRLTESERKETELKTAYIRIYRCSACSEEVKIRIPLEKDVYECCPSCGQMTLHKKEKYRTIIKATTLSEGLILRPLLPCAILHQKYQVVGRGKLGRASKTAVFIVKTIRQLPECLVHNPKLRLGLPSC